MLKTKLVFTIYMTRICAESNLNDLAQQKSLYLGQVKIDV